MSASDASFVASNQPPKFVPNASSERCLVIKTQIGMLTAAFLLISTPGSAQERPKGPPSASISIDQLKVAFIGSGALGRGTLIYGGRSYPLRVGGIGVSHLTASGVVDGLHRRLDLAGAYLQLRRG
jgi:hypothetical protein